MRRPVALSVVLALACSSSSTSNDAAVDRPTAVADVTDAGGVCCPITASSGCSGVDVYIGGWAASMGECRPTTWFDGYPMTPMTDEHGCSVLREDRTQTPCGQSRLDAGHD